MVIAMALGSPKSRNLKAGLGHLRSPTIDTGLVIEKVIPHEVIRIRDGEIVKRRSEYM